MYLNNSLYHVEKGDAIMILPFVPHRSFGNSGFAGICIEFSDNYIKDNFAEEQCKKIFSCFNTPLISLDAVSLDILIELAKRFTNGTLSRNKGLSEIMALFPARILMSDPQAKLSSLTDTSTITGYIQNNYLTIKGLDEIAGHFGISKCYLCRTFKAHTGVTVSHYINSLRIQYACKLLSETTIPISEIYELCGFSTSQYFNRVFKSIREVTPHQFRQQSRETLMWDNEETAHSL